MVYISGYIVKLNVRVYLHMSKSASFPIYNKNSIIAIRKRPIWSFSVVSW